MDGPISTKLGVVIGDIIRPSRPHQQTKFNIVANCHPENQKILFKTRNAWQSLAYSPLGAAVLPLASSSKTKSCYHLANVQRMHAVLVCLHYGNIIWLENKLQIHHLHIKRFHMMKTLRKSIQYVLIYSTKYACFLACCTWRSQLRSIISGVTWHEFTKFLHDIATSCPLVMHLYSDIAIYGDIATCFRTIVQRMQVVSFGVHDILPKSIDCHGNVPRRIGKQGTVLSPALKALSYGNRL